MPRKDYQSFASSFLDLWQEQVARALSDTDFLQALMENMQRMQAETFGYERQSEATEAPDYEGGHRHTADAFGAEPDELDALRRRMATCERKILRLEATIERLKAERKSDAERPAAATAKRRASGKRSDDTASAAATPSERASGTGRAGSKNTKSAKVARPAAKPAKPAAIRKRAVKRS